ncbi:MAG: hypothetical protein C0483_10970 [Pirellula sp.]|nr:hypothetical protein [Pirellula sp.]
MASRIPRSASDDPISAATFDMAAKPPHGKLVRRLLVALFALVVIAAAAPQIISRTPLLGQLVGWAASDVQGTVKIGEASLNWFTAPHAEQIEITGADGALVARADCVHTERTLWNLATRPMQLGRLRIERPFLNVVVRADGTTNLEEVLAKFLNAAQSPAGTPGVDFAVEVVEGAIEVRDERSHRKWQLVQLGGVVIMPATNALPLSIDLQGAIAFADGPRPFSIKCDYRDGAPPGAPTAPQGSAALDLGALPLDLVGALARRLMPDVQIAGIASGKLQTTFDWTATLPTMAVEGRLSLARPVIGGSLLAGDELSMAEIDLPIQASLTGKRLQIGNLGVKCDLVTAQAQIVVDDYTKLLNAAGARGFLDLVTQCDGKASAQISLAKIAQAMPHVMRLRDDVQITGGELSLNLESRRDGAGARQWQANLTGGSLTAIARGQAVTWDEPLNASLTARDTPTGPVVERLDCRSVFLVVEGVNSPSNFQIRAQYSLDRLTERLDQFIDLVGLQCRGEGTAEIAWTREAGDRFRVEGTASINDFQLLAPGYPNWTERQLVVGVRALGRASGLNIAALEEATLGLESAGDQLTARLTAPVTDFANAHAVLPLAVEGRGQLTTWLARLRPFVGIPPLVSAEGQVELSAVGEIHLPEEITIAQSKLTAQPFRVAMPGFALDEPSAELTLVGRYHPLRTDVAEATFNSVGTQAALRNFAYVAGTGQAPELHGELGLRGDLAKLFVPSTPLAGAAGAQPVRFGGLIEATSKLERTGAVTAVALDAVVKNLTVQQGTAQLWNEPQVRLVGSGVYEPRRDALAIDRLEIVADALRLMLTGKLDQISTARVLDCRGEATYDLAKLTPLAQTYLGNGVSFTGRETQQFQLAGPMIDLKRPDAVAWHQLQGAAKLGWEQLNLYGFPVPRNTLDATLNQGYARTSALEVPVGGGRVRIAPTVRVGPEPMEVRLDPGVLADHVTITPEMANQRLQYVMPILAGTTQVGGSFSVQLEEFRMPIDNPAAGAISGKLTVHDVEIGPGYLTQEIAALLNLPAAAKLTRESVVDFKMIEGRIYHQNLEFAFPNVVVKTMGSVGVADQSLALMAEVPIPSSILAGTPIAQSALAGQVIRVPITGTLQKPTLDREAFRLATAQFLQTAAQAAAQGALQQALGGGPNSVPTAVSQGQNAAQSVISRGQTAAQSALDKSSSAAQNALNRGQDALNRGLNKLLGPGAAAPTTTENR